MDSKESVVLLVVAGSLMIFVLVMVIIMFVVQFSKKIQQRENEHLISIKNKELELLRSVIETQESEREIIAANLHDEVGPLLATLKLKISKHKRSLAKKILTVEDLDEEREFIDNIIDNIRTASHHLTPQFVVKYGLLAALKNFVAPITNPYIKIHSNIESEKHFNNQLIINMYRIILELINNALKHDAPTEMDIFLNESKNELELIIEHNGEGLSESKYLSDTNEKNGLGLSSIKSRVLVLNGRINFIQTDTKSHTKLTIPIN